MSNMPSLKNILLSTNLKRFCAIFLLLLINFTLQYHHLCLRIVFLIQKFIEILAEFQNGEDHDSLYVETYLESSLAFKYDSAMH